MRSKRLVLRDSALCDIVPHEKRLAAVRGKVFAETWTEALLQWLEKFADLGARYGTEHPKHPGYRTLATAGKRRSLRNSRTKPWMSFLFASQERTGKNSRVSRLLEAGAEKLTEPDAKPWGQTIALVRDLNGMLVELATRPVR